MLSKSNLILTAPPGEVRAALRHGLPVGHMAYRVGGGPHLFRTNIPVTTRGGLLVMDNSGFDGRGESDPFCQEVMRECSARGFDGVICDFEGAPNRLLTVIIAQLGALLHRRGWPLYVPERYADYSPHSKIMLSSALSGGSLHQRLEEAVGHYGAQRLALAVERVAMDFFLPSPTGQGTSLTREELRHRLEDRAPSVFFSSELCAHYFTYMSKQNGAHFILYDDSGSIRKKLQVARSLDISDAILAYPQVDDLLTDILG